MAKEYLAHIAEDGREQTVAEHLAGTAALSAKFAGAFHAQEHGRLVGECHDIGKYSAAFQARLRGGPKVDHATAGAIECTKIGCTLEACAVIGHHGGLPDYGNQYTDQPGDATFCGRVKKGVSGGIPPYDYDGQLAPPKSSGNEEDLLAASYWVRMLYSCLVDADYLDTERFMEGAAGDECTYDTMPVLLERLKAYIQPWWAPKTDINRRRCDILKACMNSGARDKGIYTLTVPTGGGKTIASLAFALEHAVQHGMDRIIYVIPYTSIIEQNAAVFKEILGEKNVLEHHSNLIFDPEQEASELVARKLRATENWDAPVIVTTAVQFFESMYANRASKCRKLHNIANSVLIFDEAQMIPTAQLKPCVAAISAAVAQFGATAVLCTATQPTLNDLVQQFAPGWPICEICPDTEALYQQFRRVTFRRIGKQTTPALAEALSGHEQVLCIVNSRKAAQEIFDLLPEEGRFHLSTLMYPAHRQEVLRTVKERLREKLPCRVVSTSLIEAGVDVDFPAVYREMAGLDSLMQAAGRCNREGKRGASDSVVLIFEGENPPPPLFRMQIGACREALEGGADPGDPTTVERYFTSLRSLVGENIDRERIISALSQGVAGCLLPFEQVAQHFHLIDETTKTVYVPVEAGAAVIEKIQAGTASRADYRAAGRYSVAIYEPQMRALLAAGALSVLDDDSAVLADRSLYSAEKGLSLQTDAGQAWFI